jgi:hypothetical protein
MKMPSINFLDKISSENLSFFDHLPNAGFTYFAGKAVDLKMAIEESLKNRFDKHPEFSINGNTSLDDEFTYMIADNSELDCLIATDTDRSIDPCSIYTQIIIKLCIFESQDIETLITDYKPSKFWGSLNPAKRRELIEETLFIQEEKEQEALEAIGTESTQEKQLVRGICSIWRKGS